jgi:hypothetical protein
VEVRYGVDAGPKQLLLAIHRLGRVSGALKRTLTQTLGGAVILLPAVVAAVVIAWLSRGLRAVGLSRETAGSITVVVVVALSVSVLYVFATRFIDW